MPCIKTFRRRVILAKCITIYNYHFRLVVAVYIRTNTVVLVDGSGHATYVERTMEDGATDPDQAEWRLNAHEFDVIQETGDFAGHESAKTSQTNGTAGNIRNKRQACPIH